jgi:hypothetical protein
MPDSISQHLAATLRASGQAFAPGNEVAPCVILWTDPERLWESVMPQMQAVMPELYLLGDYAPEKRRGPSLWLRCIEARAVEGAPGDGVVPVFYLPGISREHLRAVEDCSKELAALVELQFRGAMWMHVNGKEWTPCGFLVSKHGGLGLDVPKDQPTQDALARALPEMMSHQLAQLQGKRLDADFFNGILAPDATGLLLRWLSAPDAFQNECTDAAWNAFRQQSKVDFKLDPAKDGPLKAARELASRSNQWGNVWQRFAETPGVYAGTVEWLRKAAPTQASMFDSAEVWPTMNEMEEASLANELASLVGRPQNDVATRIGELEAHHGKRREYPWQKLGMSPMATALEPLAYLAALCATSPGAPSPEAYAEYYAKDGWRVDAAALATMAACGTQEQHGAVLDLLRTLYLPWLEQTARHLQKLLLAAGRKTSKRVPPISPAPGRLVLFADGLRMDVAQILAEKLQCEGVECSKEWEWSTIPSVTASAKPAASPVAGIVCGGDAEDDFFTRLSSSNQQLTQERFVTALQAAGWQVLQPEETGDPAGAAWTESGALDKRGHNEGWKLARSVEAEVRDLASRVRSLLNAEWSEVIVATDHGWLLMPGGLPKVELKSCLAEHRWGRCAAIKADAAPGVETFHWHWNAEVAIACPPGVGCYRASIEYSHGGISLQELITPRLLVSSGKSSGAIARIGELKWTGAKCRVIVSNHPAGARVDLRTAPTDPATSLLADGQSREPGPDGKTTIFLEEDADIGREAEIVLLDESGVVIHSLKTKLGE